MHLPQSSVSKVHRLIPLYLLLQLPIIVMMKIWFRIGVEESGLQSPAKHSPSKTRLFRPFTLLALTRKRSICEGGRINGMRSLQPGGCSGMRPSLAPPATFPTAPPTRKLLKIEGLFAKWSPTSNRFWPKNRSYSKQRIKPSLTGTRTAIRDFGFLALSLLPQAAKKRASTHPSRHMSLARI
jgi:hypothetical protein